MSRSTGNAPRTEAPQAAAPAPDAPQEEAPSGWLARLRRRRADGTAARDIFSLGRRSSAVLVTIMTAMVFLSLTVSTAAVLLLGYASNWRGGVEAYLTVEISDTEEVRADARAIDVLAALEGVEGVRDTEIVGSQRVEDLLAPWFQGRDLAGVADEIALPTLVSVEAVGSDAALRVRGALARFEGVTVDDHSRWTGALEASFATVFALTLVFFSVVLIVTLSTVALAAYGAVSRNANTISVLDTIGAAAPFIAAGFGRAFLRIGFLSSTLAALVTALAFALLFLVAAAWRPPVSEFLGANVGLSTVWACLAIAALHVFVFAYVSRIISEAVVHYHLKHAD